MVQYLHTSTPIALYFFALRTATNASLSKILCSQAFTIITSIIIVSTSCRTAFISRSVGTEISRDTILPITLLLIINLLRVSFIAFDRVPINLGSFRVDCSWHANYYFAAAALLAVFSLAGTLTAGVHPVEGERLAFHPRNKVIHY